MYIKMICKDYKSGLYKDAKMCYLRILLRGGLVLIFFKGNYDVNLKVKTHKWSN
jgi:hypothetical protein